VLCAAQHGMDCRTAMLFTVQQCDEVVLEETVERLNDFLDEQLLHLHVCLR
jgi:hypothetical protein